MADDQLSPEILENLVERLDRLEQMLQNNTVRLHAIEQRLGLNAPPPRPQPAPPPPAPPRPRPEPDEEVRAETPPRESRAGSEGEVPPTRTKPRDIEAIVGGSWFNWAGILAFIFGVAFFLKLAFENDWIGPGLRVSLGGLAGLALLGAGEWLRRRGLRHYAFVISGGGVLILYLSTYAAYNFYQLLNQPIAFLLMACVTALAVLLSVRLDALPVAVLGLAGGFLTPALLSRGVDNQVALFGYVALLDAGVLAVAYFKRWRLLDFLSFLGTALVTLVWMAEYYAREKLWLTLFFLSLFFVLYALLAVVHNVLPGRRSRWFDLSLALTNAGFYYVLCYWLLVSAGYDLTAPATHAVLVSAFFLLLFYLVRTRARDDRLLAYGYVGAAVTFFTVAVGVRFDLYWVTMAWAVEALMLTWVGLRANERALRAAFRWQLPPRFNIGVACSDAHPARAEALVERLPGGKRRTWTFG
ncbi:MAG TPA: DUF2339 domain-containing protein, partial [Pyrinomonadaceae bacterium]|nr:DUF2339 domain-containing protein [Pyrinomonadaceae bacterium]